MDVPPKTPAPPRMGRRFYYGWVIVGTMFIVSVAQTAQYNPAVSIFVKPITQQFGWSRTTFSSAIGLGGIVGAGLALIVGPILDRRGPRIPTLIAFMLLGGVVMSLSQISEIWHFYAIIVTNRAIITGFLSIVAGVVVSKWFIRRRGRAMSFAVTGIRFGQAIFPPYTTFFVLRSGWQSAAIALGILVWTLTLVPVTLFLRRQPEDMGLQPDGDSPAEDTDENFDSPQAYAASQEQSFTLAQALRTRSFYLILFATSALAFNIGGINFNLFPYMTDQGLSETEAAAILTVWSLIGATGSLIVGFVAERLHVRFVMAVAFSFATGGVALLMLTDDVPTALAFSLVHGLSFGSLPMLMNLVWADYYGRHHQGAIRGFTTPFQVIVQAGGPIIGTLSFDYMETYIPAFILFAALYLASAAAMLLAAPVSLPRTAALENSGH